MSAGGIQTGTIETDIPARLDRLPWSKFHWRIIIGLGAVWILDGLEVTIVGSIGSQLTQHGSGLAISSAQVGLAGTFYVIGDCLGALFFGYLTDRFGRKRLFMITLSVYLASTALTGAAFSAWWFFLFRGLTGFGIGGEYASINSAIDELIPARARGQIDLSINGSYWFGSALGSGLSLAILNNLPLNVGWRVTFSIGVVLGFGVLLVRRNVPESPRWMFIHGREEEAERVVDAIEHDVTEDTGQELEPVSKSITVRQRKTIPFTVIARTAFLLYPRRAVLALALFVGQAFIYNGITFNLGTLMHTYFGVPSSTTPTFLIIYALGNLAGPLLLGRYFDSIGRKPMIAGTYLGSAALALVLAGVFYGGYFNRWSFIAVVVVVFFLASAGASAAYLTSSEIFPMETRAMAIAFFFAIGTGVGGAVGPALFGSFISSGQVWEVALGFTIGAGVMALGGITEVVFGVRAEQQQLEDIAKPLSVADAETGGPAGLPAGGEATAAHLESEARRLEASAEVARARAAEHRARGHDLLSQDAGAERRAEEEEVLAQIADAEALSHQEEAAGYDQLVTAEGASAQEAREEAGWRAESARQRAMAHRFDAQALGAANEAEAAAHRQRSAEALERALAHDQRAEAVAARAKVAASDLPAGAERAREAMHQHWAAMHDHLAAGHRARAEGDDRTAGDEERRAEEEAEAARARSFEVEAAEHRAEAHALQEREEQAETTERRARERLVIESREERIRQRLERRRAFERVGRRRYRPGPGRYGGYPAATVPAPLPEEALDAQIAAIERALDDRGPVERDELARMVGARYWGPGVFRQALQQAVLEGSARQLSRTLYAPVGEARDRSVGERRDRGALQDERQGS